MNTSTPNLTNASTSAATSMPTSPVSAEQDDKSHVKDEAMEVDADYDPMHVKKDHVKEVDPTVSCIISLEADFVVVVKDEDEG